MKPLSFAFLAIILSQNLLAAELGSHSKVPCDEYLVRHGAFKFQRFESDDKTCYSGADPFNVPDSMIYRSYLVTNEGLLMVFNSFSTSNAPAATGARVFYFFPRNQTPEIVPVGSAQVIYKTATQGVELILSQKKAQILGMKGGKVKENPKVSPSNAGGVEFSAVKFLYLDSGFTQGHDPTSVPSRTSKFVDSNGASCVVENSEIFNYVGDDSNFKFTDAELKDYLKSRCPGLVVGF